MTDNDVVLCWVRYTTTMQDLEAVMRELATMEGQVREVTIQIEPFKQAKVAAKKAHDVSITCMRMISRDTRLLLSIGLQYHRGRRAACPSRSKFEPCTRRCIAIYHTSGQR